MRSNVKLIQKCPTYTKEVISFDKKGKKVITKKEVSDLYLIILTNGSSVALTKKQIEEYGIRGQLPDTNETIVSTKGIVVDEIEEDLEEEEEETPTTSNTEITLSGKTSVTNNSSTIKL
jgi:hypothetical protein